jgi:hypothetical protein
MAIDASDMMILMIPGNQMHMILSQWLELSLWCFMRYGMTGGSAWVFAYPGQQSVYGLALWGFFGGLAGYQVLLAFLAAEYGFADADAEGERAFVFIHGDAQAATVRRYVKTRGFLFVLILQKVNVFSLR